MLERLPDRTFPDLCARRLTFCLKIERGCHLPALVVASQQEHSVGMLDFDGHQKTNNLDSEVPSIHVIS